MLKATLAPDLVSNYVDAFLLSAPLLSGHRIDLNAKPSTSALLVHLDSLVVKLVDPRMFGGILKSQARRTVTDFVTHEKEALRLAGRATSQSLAERLLPCLVAAADVQKSLVRYGVPSAQAAQLSDWAVAYDFFDGAPLGYYDEASRTYVYDGRVISGAGRALAEVLARHRSTIAQLNHAGLFHNDLHPQNILVATGPKSECQLRIIDFGASYIDEPTEWEQPSVQFIDRWYAQRLQASGFSLRDHRIRLRDLNLSKDLSDWDDQIRAVPAFLDKHVRGRES